LIGHRGQLAGLNKKVFISCI